MKTLSSRRRTAAFTLIEILTVITIIAILAALGFTGYRVAQKKSYVKATSTRIRAIENSLTTYFNDNGEYPTPAKEDDTTSVDGETYNVGGAKMLYQVLSGDGSDAIEGGEDASTGEIGSKNKIYWDEVLAPNQTEIQNKVRKPLVEVADGSSFYVIDGFRHPFQYQVAKKDKNHRILNEEDMYSGHDVEIWSFGPLDKPLLDEKSQEQWIKSWDMK